MAKKGIAQKGLDTLARVQLNSTSQPKQKPIDAPHEAAALEQATGANEEETTTKEKKSGRPPKGETMPLTVRLSPELLHELKLRAVMERTTQTAIIDALIRAYLNK